MRREILVGSIWRTRRKAEAARTVRVVGFIDKDNTAAPTYVRTETVTGVDGRPPARTVRTRTLLDQWFRSFIHVSDPEETDEPAPAA